MNEYNLKYAEHWGNIPKEQLQDVPKITELMKELRFGIAEKYEKLIADNDLNHEMYHPAIGFTDCEDDFVKNRTTVIIYAEPNILTSSDGNYKDKLPNALSTPATH